MAANKKKSKHVNQAKRTKTAKKSSNWIIGSVVALFAVLVLVAGIFLARSWNAAPASVPAEISDSLVIENGDSAAAQEIAEESEKLENAIGGFSEIAQENKLEELPEEEGDESSGEDGNGGWSGDAQPEGSTGHGNWGIGYVPSPTRPPAQPAVVLDAPEIPTISFPYTIPETNLTVVQISPYSGYFLEDGSGDEIGNVATIVLKNDGGDLAFAGIGIAQGDRHLAFSGSNIPAGATVIMQEQNRAPYTEDLYYSATGTTTAGGLAASAAISITDNGNNTFTVTNTSGELIGSVAISYKSYLPEEDVYVGGITYTVNLGEIEADSSVTVNSSHYVSGYSVILSAQTN